MKTFLRIMWSLRPEITSSKPDDAYFSTKNRKVETFLLIKWSLRPGQTSSKPDDEHYNVKNTKVNTFAKSQIILEFTGHDPKSHRSTNREKMENG